MGVGVIEARIDLEYTALLGIDKLKKCKGELGCGECEG